MLLEITHHVPTVIYTTQSTSRLPKLSLNGNSLHWQTFWDSFNAAVHSNTSLSGVQKFNYLKARTNDDAARAISGFPLPNANYEQAVTLLKERFGQSHKIVNAHMQAFLNVTTPSANVTSLRQFYDTIKNYVRGLSALGKSEESFGSLLIPIILSKLPAEVQKNLAREQNATLQRHLENFNTPVTKDMQRNLYVDNLISGCESEAKALNYHEEARSIMPQGKFNLRSWARNSKQLCCRADDEKTNDQSDEVCILGLQ